MAWAWNLVCGRFMNFRNGRKILTLLTFGCPSYQRYEKRLVEQKGHPDVNGSDAEENWNWNYN